MLEMFQESYQELKQFKMSLPTEKQLRGVIQKSKKTKVSLEPLHILESDFESVAQTDDEDLMPLDLYDMKGAMVQ